MPRNEKEIEDLAKFVKEKRIGRWRFAELIHDGQSGKLYKVRNSTTGTTLPNSAVIKIESTSKDGGSTVKQEVSVHKQLIALSTKSHFTALHKAGKKDHVCYMIMTLLGQNLDELQKQYFESGMPLRTLSRIGIQCLYGIKAMHDCGYIHRDVKPTTFVIGLPTDRPRTRIVHIVDFSLAREFAQQKNTGKWVSKRARKSCKNRGNRLFASASTIDGKEQGRKDDLCSLLYMLVHLYDKLPWRDADDDETQKMKKEISDANLVGKLPSSLQRIPEYLRSLEIYSRPNYNIFYDCLNEIMTNQKVSFSDSYEWESAEDAQLNKEAMANAPQYLATVARFWSWDPLKVQQPEGDAKGKEEAKMEQSFMQSVMKSPAKSVMRSVMKSPAKSVMQQPSMTQSTMSPVKSKMPQKESAKQSVMTPVKSVMQKPSMMQSTMSPAKSKKPQKESTKRSVMSPVTLPPSLNITISQEPSAMKSVQQSVMMPTTIEPVKNTPPFMSPKSSPSPKNKESVKKK